LHKGIIALDAMGPHPFVLLCLMIARAAAARLESRGVHIRSDFPGQDPAFAARSFDQHVANARG
jgi:aspartate oxidase